MQSQVISRSVWFTCSLVLALVAIPQASTAQLEINAAVGGQFGGEVYFDPPDADLDADPGVAIKLGADYFPNKLLGMGAYFSYGQSEILGLDTEYLEIGLAIKPRLTLPDVVNDWDLLLTPGFYVGYRLQTVDGAPGDDTGDGLALNLGVDIRLRFENNFAVFIEPGFITQPVGGSSDADVTWAPIGVAYAGVAYSF